MSRSSNSSAAGDLNVDPRAGREDQITAEEYIDNSARARVKWVFFRIANIKKSRYISDIRDECDKWEHTHTRKFSDQTKSAAIIKAMFKQGIVSVHAYENSQEPIGINDPVQRNYFVFMNPGFENYDVDQFREKPTKNKQPKQRESKKIHLSANLSDSLQAFHRPDPGLGLASSYTRAKSISQLPAGPTIPAEVLAYLPFSEEAGSIAGASSGVSSPVSYRNLGYMLPTPGMSAGYFLSSYAASSSSSSGSNVSNNSYSASSSSSSGSNVSNNSYSASSSSSSSNYSSRSYSSSSSSSSNSSSSSYSSSSSSNGSVSMFSSLGSLEDSASAGFASFQSPLNLRLLSLGNSLSAPLLDPYPASLSAFGNQAMPSPMIPHLKSAPSHYLGLGASMPPPPPYALSFPSLSVSEQPRVSPQRRNLSLHSHLQSSSNVNNNKQDLMDSKSRSVPPRGWQGSAFGLESNQFSDGRKNKNLPGYLSSRNSSGMFAPGITRNAVQVPGGIQNKENMPPSPDMPPLLPYQADAENKEIMPLSPDIPPLSPYQAGSSPEDRELLVNPAEPLSVSDSSRTRQISSGSILGAPQTLFSSSQKLSSSSSSSSSSMSSSVAPMLEAKIKREPQSPMSPSCQLKPEEYISLERWKEVGEKMRGRRKVLNTCPEHIGLLADFYFTGHVGKSKMQGGAKPKDYPYEGAFEIKEVFDKDQKPCFAVYETGRVLYHSMRSTVGKYLTKQVYAQGDLEEVKSMEFKVDEKGYKGSYVSFDNLTSKLDQMAGVRGKVCASLGMGRVQGIFSTRNEAEKLVAQIKAGKKVPQLGHLIFISHVTQKFAEKYNEMVSDDKRIAYDKRTIFIELANMVGGKVNHPIAAYRFEDLGFSCDLSCEDPFWHEGTLVALNNSPQLNAAPGSNVLEVEDESESLGMRR